MCSEPQVWHPILGYVSAKPSICLCEKNLPKMLFLPIVTRLYFWAHRRALWRSEVPLILPKWPKFGCMGAYKKDLVYGGQKWPPMTTFAKKCVLESSNQNFVLVPPPGFRLNFLNLRGIGARCSRGFGILGQNFCSKKPKNIRFYDRFSLQPLKMG